MAQIDLRSRQVTVNAQMILKNDLGDTLEAILAHEVGHHVRFPATMQTHARLRLLERTLIPFDDYSLINLFTDLMINERLGDRLREPHDEDLSSVHRGAGVPRRRTVEARSGIPLLPGGLRRALGPGEQCARWARPRLHSVKLFPAYRAEARVLAENLFVLGPNLYTQFLYFLSVMVRYFTPPDEDRPEASHPLQCGRGEPTPDEWAEAVTPSAAELDAIRRALKEKWFEADQAERLEQNNRAENRIAGLPGFGTQDAALVPEIMAAYYRQQAEQYLLRPPPQRRLGELQVPTTLEEWELGDPTRDIDWTATLLLRGRELGGALPLKRVKVAEEEGLEAPLWQPRMEIYLDVSGSMPNPCFAINAMTLAALILATGTVRAGGWVRALLVLVGAGAVLGVGAVGDRGVAVPDALRRWRDRRSRFDILDASVQECAGDQPIRVIITDRDFDANFDEDPANAGAVSAAAAASPRFVHPAARAGAGADRPVPRAWGFGRSGREPGRLPTGSPPS